MIYAKLKRYDHRQDYKQQITRSNFIIIILYVDGVHYNTPPLKCLATRQTSLILTALSSTEHIIIILCFYQLP